MIRVRVLAPSPALQAGLAAMLASDPGISIYDQGRAADSDQGFPNDADVDVVIIASAPATPVLNAPDAEARQKPTLYLTNEPTDIRTLGAPAPPWGLLPMDATASELQAAVRALYVGLMVAAPPLLAAGGAASGSGPLTDRETEVLTLLSRGLANKQIALELGISEHTVKFHVSSIYAKLNATNRTQAVHEGLRLGLIAL